MRLGFDEAANREYVNTGQLLGPGADDKVKGGFEFGSGDDIIHEEEDEAAEYADKTPVRALDDD